MLFDACVVFNQARNWGFQDFSRLETVLPDCCFQQAGKVVSYAPDKMKREFPAVVL